MKYMKYWTLLLSMLILSNLYGQDRFKTVSKKMYACQKVISKGDKGDVKFFKNTRDKLALIKQYSFFNDFDTLFILESFDIESGTYYGKIWNKEQDIEYSYFKNNFNFDRHQIYSKYMVKLVSEWNLKEISKEEENSHLTSPLLIYASRIVSTHKKIKVDCTVFKEFYNLQRDR